jgi:hypothetical protein
MRHPRKLLSALVCASLVASSTAAAAARVPAPQPAQPDAWMTLSMLTPAGAAVLGTAGVAAAQADQAVPPPPPERRGYDTTWLLIGSTLVLAAFLALALSHGHHHNGSVSPD